MVPYVEQMQYAYAAADFVICRSRRDDLRRARPRSVCPPRTYPCRYAVASSGYNAEPIVAAGGGLMVENENLTAEWIVREVIPLVTDAARLSRMARAAESVRCPRRRRGDGFAPAGRGSAQLVDQTFG